MGLTFWLPLKVLPESSEYPGYRPNYILSGGLNKEVKWILMQKNGVEEQEDDYAIV